MDGIKIEVTGNLARVIEKPTRITSGTVGLPVEFTYDSAWDNLKKIAMFRAGKVVKRVDDPTDETTVPWEVLENPGARLSIGVYGMKEDGTIAIPTIWANVCVIQVGVDPDADPAAAPTLPIWQTLLDYIRDIYEKLTKLAKIPPAKVSEVVLLASAWEGENSLYSQVVTIPGITENSKVDLLPSVEQLAIFYTKNVAFVTENEDGIVTVYAIGDNPTNDYTMQVQITEVLA